MSACSGRTCDLSWLIVSPAVENTLSFGVDEAWTHRYELESSDRRGSVSRLSHHQARASSDVGAAGRFRYSCISCWTLSGIEGVFSAAALLFRALSSSSKSSSRADNLSLLGNGDWEMEINEKKQDMMFNKITWMKNNKCLCQVDGITSSEDSLSFCSDASSASLPSC